MVMLQMKPCLFDYFKQLFITCCFYEIKILFNRNKLSEYLNQKYHESNSHLITRMFRGLFLVIILSVILEIRPVMVLGIFVIDERRIVASAQFSLYFWRHSRGFSIVGGSDRTWSRSSTDRSVGAAAVQSASFDSGRISDTKKIKNIALDPSLLMILWTPQKDNYRNRT
jgi:hypothetical protein